MHVVALFRIMLWVSAVPAMPKTKITSSVGEIDFKIVVVLPFLANHTHKATYRRQTTFCKGMLGCFGFWFHAENIPSLKTQNFEKYFRIKKKIIKIHRALYASLYL